MPLQQWGTFIEEPEVYVIGVQQVVDPELRRFLTDEGHARWTTPALPASEVLCEVAGRVCYMSFAGGRPHDEYIGNIKESRHGSVLEHAHVTLILTGVSRSFTHECVRHRAGWGFSQLSQRYVDEQRARFVAPRLLGRVEDPKLRTRLRGLWEDAVRAAHADYTKLVEQFERMFGPAVTGVRVDTRLRKAIRGAARSVLPNATESKIVCTVNARALRHFLELRASEEADDEIRAVAVKIYRAVLPYWPDILSDYEVRTGDDGQEFLITPYVKV